MAKQKVAETYPDFPAAIASEELDKIEKAAHSFGVNRRILLASLCRSRDELISPKPTLTEQQVGEALLTMVETAQEYEKHLDEMKEMSKSAAARLIAAAQTMVDHGLVE